jgi:hypothetical protein
VLAAAVATLALADRSAITIVDYVIAFAPSVVGLGAIVDGSVRLTTTTRGPVQADVRRWIYGGLAALFAVVYGVTIIAVIPNRLPSGLLHLWTLPAFTAVMAAGIFAGDRYGWWIGIVGGSAVLLSTIVMILRILVSAAFLAGVYGV